jgi:CRISPR-associated protein Cas1
MEGKATMPVLYVTQPGAEVRKKGARLQVEWQGQLLATLPLRLVERLVLLGPVQLSAAATQVLLQARIPVLFCNIRGNCYGVLTAGYGDSELLLAQVERYRDETYRLGIAKAIVSAKIIHQIRLLRRHARNHPNPVITQIADQIEQILMTLPNRSSVSEVMGVEGQASALYFSAFGHCLRQSEITFTERNRRPPRDPVNAILSLGYMLVLSEVLSAVMAQGLHPGLGFLHEVSNRHPALALDLQELARQPVVDRLTLSLFNRGVLTKDDFLTQPNGGVRLKEQSLKRFLLFYERAMTTPFRYGRESKVSTLRDWTKEQAQSLKKAILSGETWLPEVLEL